MYLNEKEVDEIYRHLNRKTYKLFWGVRSIAAMSLLFRDVLFDIHDQIKHEYGIESLWELKSEDLADVHDFIDCYTLPRYLEEKIGKGK